MPNVFGRRRALAACCLLLAVFLRTPALAAAPLVVEIVPQFPAEEIYRVWTPVLQRLGESTGLQFTLRIAKSIPEFEQNFVKGVPDVAFMNPYHAVMAKRAQGYEPIACDSSRELTGILVVRKDGPVQSLADLAGEEIAFPAPNAFGASLFLRARLAGGEKLQFTARYVDTHTNVYRMVARGRYAAGGGVRRTLQREPPELRAQLRVLYETPPVAPHPLVVHPRLGAALQQTLQRAILQMARDPVGAQLLHAVQMAQPRAASYADYQGLERLGLDQYAVEPLRE